MFLSTHTMKKVIKSFIPPILIDFLNLFRSKKFQPEFIQWKGNYPSWAAAAAASEGYDQAAILEKVKASTLKVKNGEAVYERDSFIFDERQYSWPLLSVLLRIAAQHGGKLNVIDFGGSLGSTYFQNKDFLAAANIELNWRVVEQAHFVEVGNKDIASDELSFFTHLEDAATEFDANILLLSGVLQCVEYPDAIIKTSKDLQFPNIIIDRTAFIDDADSRITVQYVPEWIYKASYPCRFFNETVLKQSFEDSYICQLSFESYADIPMLTEDGKRLYWKGFYFQKK